MPSKLNDNWEWKLQASYEFGDNISFIPLVHEKKKNIKTTWSLRGKSCRIKHTQKKPF